MIDSVTTTIEKLTELTATVSPPPVKKNNNVKTLRFAFATLSPGTQKHHFLWAIPSLSVFVREGNFHVFIDFYMIYLGRVALTCSLCIVPRLSQQLAGILCSGSCSWIPWKTLGMRTHFHWIQRAGKLKRHQQFIETHAIHLWAVFVFLKNTRPIKYFFKNINYYIISYSRSWFSSRIYAHIQYLVGIGKYCSYVTDSWYYVSDEFLWDN